MRVPTLATAIAAALFTGCALAPAPSHDEVVIRALPEDTRIPPVWKAAPANGLVANDWLKSLNDPQLSAIVAEAIANNLDLRQAVEKVRAAQQTVVVVGAQLLPQVGATLGARTLNDEGPGGTGDSTAAFASVGWELDVWGKLRAQRHLPRPPTRRRRSTTTMRDSRWRRRWHGPGTWRSRPSSCWRSPSRR